MFKVMSEFLKSTWRPITMIVFVALIAARWLGLAVDNIPLELEMKLMEIVQLGLGAYVIGRSGEKITENLNMGKNKE